MLPFIPELLSDVWALGSAVDTVLELLRALDFSYAPPSVLDVGCGKGAIAVAVAREWGASVTGIDAFEPFVEEARRRADESGVGQRCTFERADMRDAVRRYSEFDVAIYASLGPFLDGRPCVELLRRCVHAGGHILIDDGFLADGVAVAPDGYEWQVGYEKTLARMTAYGDKILREVILSAEYLDANNEAITEKIRVRAAKVAKRHPEVAAMLRQYVGTQHRESKILRAHYIPAVWLIQRV